MLPNRKKSSKNFGGKKSNFKVEKTEEEEEEEIEAMKKEVENEQTKTEESMKMTKELEQRYIEDSRIRVTDKMNCPVFKLHRITRFGSFLFFVLQSEQRAET